MPSASNKKKAPNTFRSPRRATRAMRPWPHRLLKKAGKTFKQGQRVYFQIIKQCSIPKAEKRKICLFCTGVEISTSKLCSLHKKSDLAEACERESQSLQLVIYIYIRGQNLANAQKSPENLHKNTPEKAWFVQNVGKNNLLRDFWRKNRIVRKFFRPACEPSVTGASRICDGKKCLTIPPFLWYHYRIK